MVTMSVRSNRSCVDLPSIDIGSISFSMLLGTAILVVLDPCFKLGSQPPCSTSQASPLLVPPVTYARAVCNIPPEKFGHITKTLVARDVVAAAPPDGLRDGVIHVQPAQLISSEREWIEELFLCEPVSPATA